MSTSVIKNKTPVRVVTMSKGRSPSTQPLSNQTDSYEKNDDSNSQIHPPPSQQPSIQTKYFPSPTVPLLHPTLSNSLSQNSNVHIYNSNSVRLHWSGPKTLGPQPQGLWKHCTVLIGSKLYIFGVYGRKIKRKDLASSSNSSVSSLSQNPSFSSSSSASSLPTSNSSSTSDSHSRISPFPTDKILIFDTETHCWKLKTQSGDIPDKGLYAHTASCIDDKVYVFGGGEASHYYNDLWILDTKNMVWSKANTTGSIPVPRRAHSATVIDNNLYIFGGGSGNSALNDLYKLDVEKLHWTQIQAIGDIPKPRGYHTTALYQKKYILLFGGSGSSEIFKDIYIFDTENKRWTKHPTEASFPRCAHSTTVVGHLLFVFGGNTGTELTNDLSVLNLDTMKWKDVVQTGNLPSKRSHHTVTFADNRLVLIGGFDGRSYLSDLHYLDLGTYGYLTSKR